MIKDVLNVTPVEAIIVTLFSMAIVFICLLVISYMIDLMRILVNKKDSKATKQPKPNEVQAPIQPAAVIAEEDDTELVAAITAAIAAMTGTNSSGLVVRNIKRIPDLDSSWSKTGKVELMR